MMLKWRAATSYTDAEWQDMTEAWIQRVNPSGPPPEDRYMYYPELGWFVDEHNVPQVYTCFWTGRSCAEIFKCVEWENPSVLPAFVDAVFELAKKHKHHLVLFPEFSYHDRQCPEALLATYLLQTYTHCGTLQGAPGRRMPYVFLPTLRSTPNTNYFGTGF
jgi:hypothetical protein